jgi:hypothetical protein
MRARFCHAAHPETTAAGALMAGLKLGALRYNLINLRKDCSSKPVDLVGKIHLTD